MTRNSHAGMSDQYSTLYISQLGHVSGLPVFTLYTTQIAKYHYVI